MIKKALKLLPFIMVAAVSLQGCSSGSNNDRNVSSTETIIDESSTGTTLSGNAVKGLMAFAPVSVFPITDGVIGTTALVEGETDASGAYLLNLASYSGPVQMQLSIDDDTLMICDAFNGCGSYEAGDALDLSLDFSIDFGDQFHPNDPELVLTALVPNALEGEDTAVQITPLTHAAALFAIANNITLDADSISVANTQIASDLNLTIDILSAAPVDITEIPENSSNSNIEYAALLGSLASMATRQGRSDSDMISLFVNSFLENGGQFLSNSLDDSNFTLEDLFANAGDVLSAAEDNSGTKLTTVQAEMEQNELTARESRVTTPPPSVPAPAPVLPLKPIDSAKALVSDVRTWGNVIQKDPQDPLDDLDQHVRAIEESLDIAADNLELKKGMENLFNVAFNQDQSQAKLLLDALHYSLDITAAVSAEGQTATNYNLGSEIPGLDSDVYEGQEIIAKGNVSVDRDAHTVNVNGTINEQSVSLHFQSSDLDSESTSVVFIRIDESQTSRVENKLARMTLAGGASVFTSIPVDLNEEIDDETIEVAVLGMEIVILEKFGTHPSTFTGTLTSVVSRDLANLDAAVDSLPLTGIPNLDEFPGIPDEIQTDFYAQHFFRVTGVAAGTEELLDGTIFLSQSASDGTDLGVNFGAFNFTGELSNGIGDRISGEFEFTFQQQLDLRRNVATLAFSGTIEAQSGESFEGAFSIESESPTQYFGVGAPVIIVDENGDDYTNLANVTLSGEFNFGTGKSILASAVANSDNAGAFVPSGEETESNFQNLNVAISLNAQFNNMPLARFTLSAQRTGFEGGIVRMDISYGGSISNNGEFSGAAQRIQLALDSQQDLDNIVSNQIIISNEQGVAITLGISCDANDSQAECENKLKDEGVRGAITVGDDHVADLDLADDLWLIRYVDGTFESLF